MPVAQTPNLIPLLQAGGVFSLYPQRGRLAGVSMSPLIVESGEASTRIPSKNEMKRAE